jgi:hypothetical protein
MAKLFGAFKGATMYEAWFWRFYITIPHWQFLRLGIWPQVGYDRSDREE